MDSTDSLSESVVKAVANAEGVDPTELDTPLYAVIDGDALNSLFRDCRGKVVFRYAGYEVTVTNGGSVDLAPLNITN